MDGFLKAHFARDMIVSLWIAKQANQKIFHPILGHFTFFFLKNKYFIDIDIGVS